jgi:hypothetical protein
VGWLGVWLFAGAAAVIVVEVAVMGVWSGRLAKRAQRLAVRLQSERALLHADVERMRLLMQETQRLWQPYGRLLHWLRHPLVAALLASMQRRLAAR